MHFSLGFLLIASFSSVVLGFSIPRSTNPYAVNSTTCKLQLSQPSAPLKYLSSKLNEFGEYGNLTDLAAEALQVTFTPGNGSERVNLRVTGADESMPMLGGISGFFNEGDDLGSGSYHHAYMGLTAQTPSGSIPQRGTNSFDKIQDFERKIQSAIWSFDPATKRVTPQWVNTNRSTTKNYLVYVDKQNVVVITGDKDKFIGKFQEEFEAQGAHPIEVTLNCV